MADLDVADLTIAEAVVVHSGVQESPVSGMFSGQRVVGGTAGIGAAIARAAAAQGAAVVAAGRRGSEQTSGGVRATAIGCTPNGQQLSRVAEIVDAGQVRPNVGKVMTVDEAATAQELNRTGGVKARSF